VSCNDCGQTLPDAVPKPVCVVHRDSGARSMTSGKYLCTVCGNWYIPVRKSAPATGGRKKSEGESLAFEAGIKRTHSDAITSSGRVTRASAKRSKT
jgi:hypothetical protein